MKRLLLLVCIATFLAPITLHAQPAKKNFYLGAGGTWAVTDSSDPYDSPGLNLKFGYHAHRLLDLEFNFDWIDKFENGGQVLVMGVPVDYREQLEVMTFMVALKGYFPIPSDIMRLAVVAGGGLMVADYNLRVSDGVDSLTGSEDEIEFCGKLGLAFDYFVAPEFSIGAEGNYTFGVEDLSDLEYWHFALGVAYHF